jgi:hypothetical protein
LAKERRDGSFGGHGKPGFSVQPDRESFLKGLPNDWGKDCGFRARKVGEWGIIELDPWADPRKTTEWATRTIAAIGPQRFQREFLRNWSLSTQSPFYPEYSTFGGDDHFVHEFASVGNGPLAMGLDFGVRRPALIAMQGNARKTRLYVLREWCPINVHSAVVFLEVAEWLMGELEEEQLSAHALVHVMDLKRQAADGRGPSVPWFKGIRNIVRYTGPEALRTSQEVTNESEERRIVDIWAARGFPLSLQSSNVKGGTEVIRHLLRPGHSKWPYLMLDKSCTLLREAFNGGYTFAKPTREHPIQDKPAKNGIHDNPMDALRYGAVALIDPSKQDAGDLDESVQTVVHSEEVEARKTRDVYERANRKDDGDGYSTLFGTVSPVDRSVYRREA